ncbi:MFS transporter [Streptomyces sp. SB3404]|uniref:alpha-amylase n=1 Tax=Streptomyces boncukensis TaxID=2711219 RepID=A0A6G4X9C2_9ACTN|nr:MFS transporter [Streptomyces boncukensis]
MVPAVVEVTFEVPDSALPLPAQRSAPPEPSSSGTGDDEADEIPPPLPVEPGRGRMVLVRIGLALALALAAVEQTVLAPVLPDLLAGLDGGGRAFWVLALPLVAACGGPYLFGRLGDRCGHKGALLLALALCTAGTALAGWAGSVSELTAFRAVQGVAAGGVLGVARGLVAETAPLRTRGRQLGLLGALVGVSAAAGPALGGWLTEEWGWRWCFHAAVPAGLLALALCAFAPRAPRTLRVPRAPRGRALPHPYVPLVGVALAAALLGAAYALPHYLRLAGGGSVETGLLVVPPLGGALVAAVLAEQLIVRTGSFGVFAVLGCAMGGEGVWLLSRVADDTTRADLAVRSAILGLGIGFVLPVLVLAVRLGVRHTPAAGQPGGPGDWPRRAAGGVGAGLVALLLAHRLAVVFGPGAADLPDGLREVYESAYADALPRASLSLAPMLLLGLLFVFLLKLKENPPVSQHTPVPHARTPEAAAPAGTPAAPPAGVPVCGSVRHPDGGSVPNAALTLVDTSGRQVGRGATGEDGRYALSTPGEGAYVLIAAAGGHQPRAVSVTVGERPVEVDVVLGGAGRLAGTVLTADGQPVKDAAVTLTDVRGEVVATARSGREGGYVIADLVAGEYTLAASAPVYRPAALPVSVQASRETRQDIELAGGAVLRGTVRAGGGRPVDEARVTLLDAAGNVVDTVTTGADGSFRFVDLASGEYTVVAAGYPPVATVLQIAGGGRTERDLQLGHED